MLEFTLAFLSALLMGLVVAAGIQLRARIRRRIGPLRPRVDDAAVRAILERGVVVSDEDEPLDLDEIEREERRFWTERWDEADEW